MQQRWPRAPIRVLARVTDIVAGVQFQHCASNSPTRIGFIDGELDGVSHRAAAGAGVAGERHVEPDSPLSRREAYGRA